MLAETGRVGGQVREGTLEGERLERDHGRAGEAGGGLRPHDLCFRLEILQDKRHVGGRCLFVSLATSKGEVVLQHGLHFVHVALERAHFLAIGKERELKTKPGEDGAQVVAHAGQHGRSLLDLPFDAPPHLDEGLGGAADLTRAGWAEVVDRTGPLPKLSAAVASRSTGRVWLRRNSSAMIISTSDVDTIQTMKKCELEA